MLSKLRCSWIRRRQLGYQLKVLTQARTVTAAICQVASDGASCKTICASCCNTTPQLQPRLATAARLAASCAASRGARCAPRQLRGKIISFRQSEIVSAFVAVESATKSAESGMSHASCSVWDYRVFSAVNKFFLFCFMA